MDIDVELCRREGAKVTGRLHWSSAKSGENVRRLAGRWSDEGQRLVLRDVEMLVDRPKPGWRFCLIDRSSTKLTGSYRSSACYDRASVTLTRVKR